MYVSWMEPSSTALGKTKGNAPGWYGVTNPPGDGEGMEEASPQRSPASVGLQSSWRSPIARLPRGLQPGSCHSPVSKARPAGGHPSQLTTIPAPRGPTGGTRVWLCARGAAASQCRSGPEVQPVCAQPTCISDPYKRSGQDEQNQPSYCFVHQ